MPARTELPDEAAFSRLIRARRKEIGLSQEGLAMASGIAQPNLSRIERGDAGATLATYLRICEALGIDISGQARS